MCIEPSCHNLQKCVDVGIYFFNISCHKVGIIFAIFTLISLFSLTCTDKVNISSVSSFLPHGGDRRANCQAGIAPARRPLLERDSLCSLHIQGGREISAIIVTDGYLCYKEPKSPYNFFLIVIFNELFEFKTSDERRH